MISQKRNRRRKGGQSAADNGHHILCLVRSAQGVVHGGRGGTRGVGGGGGTSMGSDVRGTGAGGQGGGGGAVLAMLAVAHSGGMSKSRSSERIRRRKRRRSLRVVHRQCHFQTTHCNEPTSTPSELAVSLVLAVCRIGLDSHPTIHLNGRRSKRSCQVRAGLRSE